MGHPSGRVPARRSGTPARTGCGVEDHQVERVLRAVHLAQHEVGVDRLVLDLVLALDVGIDRDEVVAAAHLHAVAGVVEEADAAGGELVAEGADGAAHPRLAGILEHRHLEARLGERLRDGARIAYGVAQRRALVGGVADDERHAALAGGRRLDRRDQQRAVLRGRSRGHARQEQHPDIAEPLPHLRYPPGKSVPIF
jgi:hypothetical protein